MADAEEVLFTHRSQIYCTKAQAERWRKAARLAGRKWQEYCRQVLDAAADAEERKARSGRS